MTGRVLGMAVQALARQLLSGRPAADALVRPLRHGLRHGRNQQHLLSPARANRRSPRWAARAPRGFLFAVKASRFLTHMKKLKDPEEPLDRFFSRMPARSAGISARSSISSRLAGSSTVTGWSTSCRFSRRGVRHVIEFREPSLVSPTMCSTLLERHRVTLCLHDMPGSATGRMRIGPSRLRAISRRRRAVTAAAIRTTGSQSWAGMARTASATRGADVYAYFNNDVGGHAPRNALALRRHLERARSIPAEAQDDT